MVGLVLGPSMAPGRRRMGGIPSYTFILFYRASWFLFILLSQSLLLHYFWLMTKLLLYSFSVWVGFF